MTHHHTPGPVSRRAALAGLGASGLGLALTATRPAAAQDTTPADAAGSPLVGMWQWNSFPESPEPANFAIFHADGTYAEWQPVAGEAIGIWRMTGERTFDLLFIFPDTDPSLEGFAPGEATFTITGELDETGNALTATGTIGVRDPGGVHLVDVPWTRPATRVTFETNPSTGSIPATPVAATPSA
jgi:PKD repeat protein